MTDMQASEAALLLEEVEKRRLDIRRRLGNGWFELTVFGTALLAAGIAGVVSNGVGFAEGVACALVFAVAYIVVGARYVRLRQQFGVGMDIFHGLLFSAVIFAGCSLAGWMLDGTAEVVAIALIPTVALLAMAFVHRQRWIVAMAAIMCAGGLSNMLPGTGVWAQIVIYGGGFLLLGVYLLRKYDSDRAPAA
jgi:hypothetical protein